MIKKIKTFLSALIAGLQEARKARAEAIAKGIGR